MGSRLKTAKQKKVEGHGNRKEEMKEHSESQSHVDAGPEEMGVKERPEAGCRSACTKTRGWKKETGAW